MRIEDFGPYQQALKKEQAGQQVRLLTKALLQVLRIQPGVVLGPMLGVELANNNQEALERWVEKRLELVEAGQGSQLEQLMQIFQKEMSGKWG